jgi:hypothetical protein
MTGDNPVEFASVSSIWSMGPETPALTRLIVGFLGRVTSDFQSAKKHCGEGFHGNFLLP